MLRRRILKSRRSLLTLYDSMKSDRGLGLGFGHYWTVHVLVLLEINCERLGLRLVLRGVLSMQSINLVCWSNLNHAAWMRLLVATVLVNWCLIWWQPRGVVVLGELGQKILSSIGTISMRQVAVGLQRLVYLKELALMMIRLKVVISDLLSELIQVEWGTRSLILMYHWRLLTGLNTSHGILVDDTLDTLCQLDQILQESWMQLLLIVLHIHRQLLTVGLRHLIAVHLRRLLMTVSLWWLLLTVWAV